MSAQSVYGAWALSFPNNGQRQVGVIDPTTGLVSLIGPGAVDSDNINTTTGITAIALAANVFYFIGEDQGDGLSKLFSVDLSTGQLNPTPAVAMPLGYGVGQVQGLWYSDGTATLYGLFTAVGGDREVVSINTTTGAVTTVQALVAGAAGFPGALATASGVFTGDPDGNRVFFVGTLDSSGEPALMEVSLDDGSSIAHIGEGDVDESNVVGIEWDTENQTIWVTYRAGEVFFASIGFEEGESFVESQTEVSFNPIGTQTGLTALDDATGQFFFIGLSSGWRIFTIDVNTLDGTEGGGSPANPQFIIGPIFAGAYPGIEVLPGPQLSIGKTDGGVTASPGQTITYDIILNNAIDAGPGNGLQLTETVPAETTFNGAASTAGWNCLPDNNAGSVCTLSLPDLAPGGSNSVDFAVDLAASVSAGLVQVDNTVTLSAANSTDTPQASDSTPVNATVDLQATKSDGSVTVVPGDTITYSLIVSNFGNRAASDVIVSETVPTNSTFNAMASDPAWACVPDGQAGSTCTLNLGTYPGGSSQIINFAVDVIDSVAAGTTQIDNAAQVTASNAPTVPLAESTPVTAAPVLALTKSDGDANAVPGAVLTFSLDYQNTGNMDTLNAVLTDTVPAQTTFNPAASSAGWTCLPDNTAGSICALAVPTLAGGNGGSVDFAVTVDTPVLANTPSIDNTAEFDANNASAVMASDSAPMDSDPLLTLTKSSGGLPTTVPGATPSFVLLYGNIGNENAADVVITETVPDHTSFRADKSSPGWVCAPDDQAGSTCTFDIGTVVGGTSDLILFTVEVDNPVDQTAEFVDNTASIAAANNSALPVMASASVPIDAQAVLALTKDDGDVSAIPGDLITWQLDYSNIGNQEGAALILLEVVPANTTFAPGASDPGWVCADTTPGSNCFLDLFDLDGGASGSATFSVTVNPALPLSVTSIDNTAQLTAANASSVNASDSTPVSATLDLAIAKSDGGVIPTPGGVLVYALDYSNNGNTETNGVTLTETVPDNTTFNAGASTVAWVCVPDGSAGSTCTFSLGTVAAGASGTIDFAVDLPDPFPPAMAQLYNTASIADDGALGADQVPENNSASISTGLDDTPPTVTGVDVPGIGAVASCDQLDGLVDTLQVSFADDLTPIQGADQATNYLLVDAGSNGQLETLACGSAAGDDRVIAITSASVSGDPLTPTATLTLVQNINGQPYHLLVCDAITDGAGNGLAGGDFLRRFRVDRGNRFENAYLDDCLDQMVTLEPWTSDAVNPAAVVANTDDDVDDDLGSGSIAIALDGATSITVGQCVDVSSGGSDWSGSSAYQVAAASDPTSLQWICETSTTPDCSDVQSTLVGSSVVVDSVGSGGWQTLSSQFAIPASAASAYCGLQTDSASASTVRLDALRFIAPLFADRFQGN
ncbi:MAG: hypothetical protein AAGJ52_01250 [Pseudomonadota bacterium]